jgi:hypothetical protein
VLQETLAEDSWRLFGFTALMMGWVLDCVARNIGRGQLASFWVYGTYDGVGAGGLQETAAGASILEAAG